MPEYGKGGLHKERLAGFFALEKLERTLPSSYNFYLPNALNKLQPAHQKATKTVANKKA